MIHTFKDKRDLENIREATRISTSILKTLKEAAKIGVTPYELNELAWDLCNQNRVEPAFLGVPGPKNDFPGNLCVSVNEETLHTIPFSERKFESGDIVKVDFGIIYNDFYTDHCVTVGLGDLKPEEKKLIETTRVAIDTALKHAVVGNKVGKISNTLQTLASMANFDYIRGYSGHGIGKTLWEEPSIPYHGQPTDGEDLEEGMLLCVEVQYSLGSGKLKLDRDGWTLRTEDGSKTAMYEHMVLVGKEKPEVLTRI